MMQEQKTVEDLAVQASAQYSMALYLKDKGRYSAAFELFKRAARKYESLANYDGISPADRLDYLGMQRECLEAMLVDAFNFNIVLWANVMLKLKGVKGDIEMMC